MKRSFAEDHLKHGYPLIFDWGEDGIGRYYLGGHGISVIQARALIRDFELVENGDVLFKGLASQTWRLP